MCGAAALLAQFPWERMRDSDAAPALAQLAALADAVAARAPAGADGAPGVRGALDSLLAVNYSKPKP